MPQPKLTITQNVTARLIEVMKSVIESDPLIKNQIGFAKAIDVHPVVLSRWVQQTASCTLENVVNLCNRFQANPIYLIMGVGEMFLYQERPRVEIQMAELLRRLNLLEISLKEPVQKNGTDRKKTAKRARR